MDSAQAEPEDLFCDALELAAPAERAAYLDRLVQLYENWDRPAEAARWRKELEPRKGNEK
jgi:hypothetical protein